MTGMRDKVYVIVAPWHRTGFINGPLHNIMEFVAQVRSGKRKFDCFDYRRVGPELRYEWEEAERVYAGPIKVLDPQCGDAVPDPSSEGKLWSDYPVVFVIAPNGELEEASK